MVINHLLTGMILQVPSGKLRWQMENEPNLKDVFPSLPKGRVATVRCLEKVVVLIPNGGFVVIYHGTIRKQSPQTYPRKHI